ncbi:MAG: hypothetical protein FWC46_04145 [Actinomycetia bacterium]|nr:hypothetical protein [Actinomycetes bacterium]
MDKQRCLVCGRVLKPGVNGCAACGAMAGEAAQAEFRAVQHVTARKHPTVDIVATNRRLVVFLDVSNTGSLSGAAAGGLLGYALGKAADKIIAGANAGHGKVLVDVPWSAILGVTAQNVLDGSLYAGWQLAVSLVGGTGHTFTLVSSRDEPPRTAEAFVDVLRSWTRTGPAH